MKQIVLIATISATLAGKIFEKKINNLLQNLPNNNILNCHFYHDY